MTNYNPIDFKLVLTIGLDIQNLEAFQKILNGVKKKFHYSILLIPNSGSKEIWEEELKKIHWNHHPYHIIQKNTSIEPGNIYFLPPDQIAIYKNHSIILSSLKQKSKSEVSIDIFLKSISNYLNTFCFSVLLSNGKDGFYGLKLVQNKGGKSFIPGIDEKNHPVLKNFSDSSEIYNYSEFSRLLNSNFHNLLNKFKNKKTSKISLNHKIKRSHQKIDFGNIFTPENPLVSKAKIILLEDFSPPSAIINKSGKIIYNNKLQGNFLEIRSLENIFEMIRIEFNIPILTAIEKIVSSAQKEQEIKSVSFIYNEKMENYKVHISPIEENFLLVFYPENREELYSKKEDSIENNNMELELRDTQEYLNSTINQLKDSNEVLNNLKFTSQLRYFGID